MKSTATSLPAQDKAEPARSHAGNPLRSNSSTGYLGQLSAMINSSPGVQALAQMKENIQGSTRVQSLQQLAEEIQPGAPAQLRQGKSNGGKTLEYQSPLNTAEGLAAQLKIGIAGTLAHSNRGAGIDDATEDHGSSATESQSSCGCGPKQETEAGARLTDPKQEKSPTQRQLQPTMQMEAGVPINDSDIAIQSTPAQRREDESTAQRAAEESEHAPAAQAPVQLKMKQLTEEEIKRLEEEGTYDADFLDGLYQGERGPKFYVYAGFISAAYLKDAAPEQKIHLYLSVDLVTEEGLEQVYRDLASAEFVSEDETIVIKGSEIYAKVQEKVNKGEADKIINNLVGRAINAEPKEGVGGEFGAIEFRFAPHSGYIFLSDNEEHVTDAQRKGFDAEQRSTKELQIYQEVYKESGFPYTQERIGSDFLYLSVKEFVKLAALSMGMRVAGPDEHVFLNPKAGVDEPPIPAPGAAAKEQPHSYKRPAVRGSRGEGQKAAMNNVSAQQYVAWFIGQKQAKATRWEWLHLRGSRLGGKNNRDNLVAGSYASNSHMIPWEHEILRLSREADNEHPLNVVWSATLKQVDGQNTHVGDKISIAAKMPEGTKSNETPREFAKEFDPTQGAPFTKIDRDSAVFDAQTAGGRKE